MAPTIKEVARLARVSTASVSMVINQKYKGQISEEKRIRILEAVKKLGYTPHRYGRALKLQKSEIIGYTISLPSMYVFSDPYFHDTIITMEKKLKEYDYSLLFFTLSPQEGNSHLLEMNEQVSLLDGLIIEAPPLKDPLILELEKKKIPAVLIGRHPDAKKIPFVDVDNVDAGYRATEHLIKSGKKNICFISGPLVFKNALDRLKGYKNALARYGIVVNPGMIREGDLSIESGYTAMAEIMNLDFPDGLVAGNDLMAIGAMNFLKEKGFKIPEEIAVVGFNNTSLSQHYDPPLTTVNIPASALAEKAVEILIGLLNGNGTNPEQSSKVLDSELMIRESTNLSLTPFTRGK